MIQQHQNKKRVLKKIRRQTITRCQEDNETSNIVITDLKPQTSDKIFLINPCFGLVENDRKICMGTQYLNLFFNIASLSIDNHAGSKAVTLNLNLNDNNNSYTHWESTVERLESYGEAESTSWAYRIRKHYSNYPALMAKYFDLLHSNDPQVYASLRKAKARAILACKEIERKYTYRKLLTYSTKDSTEILSISYSESLLEEMGHTVEGFVEWTKENGVPTLFNSECPSHLDLAKNFFECATLNGGPIQERSEYVTPLFNKDGSQEIVVAQYITITEPTHNGFFNSGYFILKRKFEGDDDKLCDKINLEAEIQINDDGERSDNNDVKEKMTVEDS